MRERQPQKASAQSPDNRFRAAIGNALANGASLDQMTLRLTLRDASLLARDRMTPVEDIGYRDSVMHFLGVKVEAGGVPTSTLDLGSA
ncbi:hypothetical protein [Phenylobacterium sp.]|jgi:hypothetical protein|uniref:hypothetical protein n=1 Tax=Phenylobacterium sp. TaxID=1871053 RepID=UPI003784C8E1